MSKIQSDWAKTFDTAHGQVLIYWIYDSEVEKDVVHCMVKTPMALMDMSFDSEEDGVISKRFAETATQETAEAFSKEAFDMLDKFSPTTPAAEG